MFERLSPKPGQAHGTGKLIGSDYVEPNHDRGERGDYNERRLPAAEVIELLSVIPIEILELRPQAVVRSHHAPTNHVHMGKQVDEAGAA